MQAMQKRGAWWWEVISEIHAVLLGAEHRDPLCCCCDTEKQICQIHIKTVGKMMGEGRCSGGKESFNLNNTIVSVFL